MNVVKRVGLCLLLAATILVLVNAAFDEIGGFFPLFDRAITMDVAVVDSVLERDSAVTKDYGDDTIRCEGTLFTTAPSQQGLVTFLTGAFEDSTRYITKASGDASDDTIWLASLLSDTAATGDSLRIEFLTDFVTIETTTVTHEDMPVMASNLIIGRLVSMSSYDSTGVKIVVQNRLGDNGTWNAVFTAVFDTIASDSTAIFADTDTLTSGDYLGDQWRTLVIVTDSVSYDADRVLTADVEVFWRGKKY